MPKTAVKPSLNGFVNLYKPSGITSMDALRRIKRLSGQKRKVGHGGTMDPLAKGVLPVCFGQATRLMDHVVGGRKKYLMEVLFGVTTTTYDKEGEVVATRDASSLTLHQVEDALLSFDGVIDQLPPMYSAVKIGGQRLYKLARAGVEVERKPREVEIHDIRIVRADLPALVLEVECGKGAYMRSLAHDLGELLGCGAHVVDLERLSCGAFKAETAVTLDQLDPEITGGSPLQEHLLPVDWVLRDLKSVSFSPRAEQYLRHGQTVSVGRARQDAGYLEEFRAYGSDGRFLAIVRFNRADNSWIPVKVFEIDAPSPYAPAAA